jgi:chromosome segregation ATPase
MILMIEILYLKGMSEKMSKQVESQISDLSLQIEESKISYQEVSSVKVRLQAENSEFTRQIEESESRLNQLSREKHNYITQLEEARHALDDESRVFGKMF